MPGPCEKIEDFNCLRCVVGRQQDGQVSVQAVDEPLNFVSLYALKGQKIVHVSNEWFNSLLLWSKLGTGGNDSVEDDA